MAEPITLTFQVVAQDEFIRKFADARFVDQYKLYVLREITEGALETIRRRASTLWKNPTSGGLDQSWHSRIDAQQGVGFIWNSKPYAYWQNVGVRPHKMVYLMNARNARDYIVVGGETRHLPGGERAAIIPIARDGKTTFRLAMTRHMTRNPGGPPWWHPGLAPKRFLEQGLQEYRDLRLRDDYAGLTIKVLGLAT
jgi:hypothetical protein